MENQLNNTQPDNDAPKVEQPQWQYQSGKLQLQNEPTPNVWQQQVLPQDEKPSNELSENNNALASWSASEFIAHDKPSNWYIILATLTILSSVVIFIITREIFSVLVVVVMAFAVGVYGGVKPRTLTYEIFPDSIRIGGRDYPYTSFRSFSVIEGTSIPSIQLIPQKRIAVPISIFCTAADIDAIVAILGDFLPYEHKERDPIDKISSRFRF
jgi:hypothetical protein